MFFCHMHIGIGNHTIVICCVFNTCILKRIFCMTTRIKRMTWIHTCININGQQLTCRDKVFQRRILFNNMIIRGQIIHRKTNIRTFHFRIRHANSLEHINTCCSRRFFITMFPNIRLFIDKLIFPFFIDKDLTMEGFRKIFVQNKHQTIPWNHVIVKGFKLVYIRIIPLMGIWAIVTCKVLVTNRIFFSKNNDRLRQTFT